MHPSDNRIFSISITLLFIVMLLNLGNIILQPSYSEMISYGNNGNAHSNCNCVVFRMDDVQDYFVRSAQLAIMNHFMQRNQSLTLGIIMNAIGNDSEIINKVKQGNSTGLFELAVHGWNHTNYINLTEEEQRLSLENAHKKMLSLFGTASEIFIPPYDAFNSDTLNAMRQVDMKIIDGNASSIDKLQLKDDSYNNGSSNKNNTNSESGTNLSLLQSKKIFYIPSTIQFKDYYGGKYLRNSDQSILNNVTQSINAYGYAVVVVHPQDFVKVAANGSLTPTIDDNQINDLYHLIDLMSSSSSSNNMRIGSFSNIIAGQIQSNPNIIPSFNSTPQAVRVDEGARFFFASLRSNFESAPIYNCSGGWQVAGDFTPAEYDYDGRGYNQTVTVYHLDNSNITTVRTLNSEFLKDVQVQGWGLTKKGDYIGGWDSKFWGPSPAALNYRGEPLIAGISAATDENILPYGSNFTIPTLPSPWNNKTFTAVDDAPAPDIVGKQITIYVGLGSDAEKEAARISGTSMNTVCVFPILRPPDPVSTDGVGYLDSAMAEIYNKYGKYIYEKASEIKVSPASIAAVIYVESSGKGFGEDGKMIIRFEPCVFYDLWGKYHPQEFSQYFECDRPNDKFRKFPAQEFGELHGDHAREWTAFNLARALNEHAAMNSISMGLAQIMGFHHLDIGYSSANEMFDALSNSTQSQLDALFLSLTNIHNGDNSCLGSLQARDYVSFANCYNGEGMDQEYGSAMSQAAESYKLITSNRKYPSS